MNKLSVKNINLVIGYFFLFFGCVGCLIILGFIFGYGDISLRNRSPFLHSSIAPIFSSVVTAIGAYLVKE
jgi:hypothetical protein